jgi:hypothetical protein
VNSWRFPVQLSARELLTIMHAEFAGRDAGIGHRYRGHRKIFSKADKPCELRAFETVIDFGELELCSAPPLVHVFQVAADGILEHGREEPSFQLKPCVEHGQMNRRALAHQGRETHLESRGVSLSRRCYR